MRRSLVMSLVLALAVVGSACADEEPDVRSEGGDDGHGGHEHEDAGEGHDAQGTKEIGGYEATYHGDVDLTGESAFQLELDDSYFGPTVLQGAAGQQLDLDLHNEGGLPHTFTIDEVGIDEELPSGAEGISIDVTFPDSGALVFYCRFHRDQGMVGALSVGGSLETGGASMDGEGGAYG